MSAPPPTLALRHLLAWVAARPRCYGSTMEAWRSTCPRLSVWEDALMEGLVAVRPHDGPAGEAPVVLTAKGHAALFAG